ncbi:hypothetical protein C4J94_5097 [Pseudomonas sp. R5-89-07]|nr:hypothetical protein C4J94_5097 [Pseudomonas sp. R5-89-07]
MRRFDLPPMAECQLVKYRLTHRIGGKPPPTLKPAPRRGSGQQAYQ